MAREPPLSAWLYGIVPASLIGAGLCVLITGYPLLLVAVAGPDALAFAATASGVAG